MKLRVLKPFIDKYTQEEYEVGQEIEVTEKRGFDIIYNPILGPSFVEPILDVVTETTEFYGLEPKTVTIPNHEHVTDSEIFVNQDTIIQHDGEEEVINYPQHVGGGQYLLSNGSKVKGKEAAIEAEKELIGE